MAEFNVSEVLKLGAELSNVAFSLKGILVVDGDDCFVVANTDAFDERIVLNGDVLNKLLNEVPCYVGSNFLYNDKVKILGELSDLDNLTLAPKNIVIERDGEELSILFE